MAVAEIRRIIDDLRPTALDSIGLMEAIRRHAATVSTVLHVDIDAADVPTMPLQVESAAYRIATEALTNAVRHADARNVRLSLTTLDRTLRITVADDGHGVGATTPGVGLASMRHRAEALGGHLHIDTAGTGTTITAVLPLEQP